MYSSELFLTGTNEYPTVDTIEYYMSKVQSIIMDAPQQHESFVAAVLNIVSRLKMEV